MPEVKPPTPPKTRDFYTIERTSSPHRWNLVRLSVDEDNKTVVQSHTESNVPGLIKSRLLLSVLRDIGIKGGMTP